MGKCIEAFEAGRSGDFYRRGVLAFLLFDRKRGGTEQGTSVGVKKKSATQGESFLVTHSVYKVTRSLSPARPPGVRQEEFSCNSIHWVSLPEILVMASLLRIVPSLNFS